MVGETGNDGMEPIWVVASSPEEPLRRRLLDLREGFERCDSADVSDSSEEVDTSESSSVSWRSTGTPSGSPASAIGSAVGSISTEEGTGCVLVTEDLFFLRNGNGAGMWILANVQSKGQLQSVGLF